LGVDVDLPEKGNSDKEGNIDSEEEGHFERNFRIPTKGIVKGEGCL